MDVRQSILRATAELLEEHRLDGLTVVDIIDSAEISRASFYMYFESKHAVVAALAETVMEAMYDEVWQPWLAGKEPAENLAPHMLQTLQLWREHRAIMLALAEGWRTHDAINATYGQMMGRYLEDVRDYIQRARDAGTAPTDLDAETLAEVLVWGNENTMYLTFSGDGPDPENDEKLAETLAGVWLRAIYGSPPDA